MRQGSALAAFLVLLASAGQGFAGEIKERTSYFTVQGATLDELDAELSRKGPVLSQTGLRHPGATQVKFDGRVTYRSGGTTCRVGSTALRLRLSKTLPRWRAPRAASPQTVIVWKTLSEDIARHEEGHAQIARSWFRKMESAIRNLSPASTCARMEAEVNRVSARYLESHERAQREFDTIEGREINDRLRRALKRNVEAAAGKT